MKSAINNNAHSKDRKLFRKDTQLHVAIHIVSVDSGV